MDKHLRLVMGAELHAALGRYGGVVPIVSLIEVYL